MTEAPVPRQVVSPVSALPWCLAGLGVCSQSSRRSFSSASLVLWVGASFSALFVFDESEPTAMFSSSVVEGSFAVAWSTWYGVRFHRVIFQACRVGGRVCRFGGGVR